MKRARIVIIGAGLAGAATAWKLAERGEGDVVVLEKEEFPGMHASGRSAAMIRQLIEDPQIAALARESTLLFRYPPIELAPQIHFDETGSLLIGSENDLGRMLSAIPENDRDAVSVHWLTRKEAQTRVPALANAIFDAALWTKTDGVIDASALLHGFLKCARRQGGRIVSGCEVRDFHMQGARIECLETNLGRIEVEMVVNAAGAWAQQLAYRAGGQDYELEPLRRHLFMSGPLLWVDRRWPFVWDVTQGVYFRPESGGLLMCACDESRVSPGVPDEDPAVRERLAEKLTAFYPTLSDVSVCRSWVGSRTFAPQRRFVIERDERLENFFWVAGLGGAWCHHQPGCRSPCCRKNLRHYVAKDDQLSL